MPARCLRPGTPCVDKNARKFCDSLMHPRHYCFGFKLDLYQRGFEETIKFIDHNSKIIFDPTRVEHLRRRSSPAIPRKYASPTVAAQRPVNWLPCERFVKGVVEINTEKLICPSPSARLMIEQHYIQQNTKKESHRLDVRTIVPPSETPSLSRSTSNTESLTEDNVQLIKRSMRIDEKYAFRSLSLMLRADHFREDQEFNASKHNQTIMCARQLLVRKYEAKDLEGTTASEVWLQSVPPACAAIMATALDMAAKFGELASDMSSVYCHKKVSATAIEGPYSQPAYIDAVTAELDNTV